MLKQAFHYSLFRFSKYHLLLSTINLVLWLPMKSHTWETHHLNDVLLTLLQSWEKPGPNEVPLDGEWGVPLLFSTGAGLPAWAWWDPYRWERVWPLGSPGSRRRKRAALAAYQLHAGVFWQRSWVVDQTHLFSACHKFQCTALVPRHAGGCWCPATSLRSHPHPSVPFPAWAWTFPCADTRVIKRKWSTTSVHC